MNSRICDVGEKVWCELYSRGPMEVAELSGKLEGASPNEVTLAVGWLAGEGQVEIVGNGDFRTLTLRHRM